MTDSEAIQAVRRGEKQRYAELVDRYQKMVYGIAWSRLGDAHLCEEAAQETFVRAYRYLMALRNPEKFPAWLGRIARNVSVSLLRERRGELEKRRRWQVLQPTEPEPADEEPAGQTLRETLAAMPAQHRECLVLFYLEGKDIREAAGLLGISETAFKTRLHRARVVLRARLEERLEGSLSGLRPHRDFTAAVLPLLPAAPISAGVGGTFAAAKVLGGTFKFLPLSMLLWMPLFQGAFAGVFFSWLAKLEAANLRPGAGATLRKSVIRNNAVLLVIAAVSAMLGSFLVVSSFGPVTLYRLLALFSVWGVWRTARLLRINRTPFVLGQLLFIIGLGIVCVAIGFFGAPLWTFLAMLLPVNVVLYHTNKTRPMRHDYNLFLRRTLGLLNPPEQAPEPGRSVTRTQLRAFTRFLGERFLIQDRRFDSDGVLLRLPPVKPGLDQYFRFITANSSVRLAYDGCREAQLGRRDLRDLRALDHGTVDPAALEEQVAETVAAALHAFVDGRPKRAEMLLQAEQDDHIFETPVGTSREHRVRGGIAILAAAFLLYVAVSHDWRFWDTRNTVSREAAGAALVEWSRAYDPARSSDFSMLLNSDAIPPLDIAPPEGRAAYKAAFIRYLAGPTDSVEDRIYRGLQQPRGLYNAISGWVLRPEDLKELGFTPGNVRAAVRDLGPGGLQAMNDANRTRTGDGVGFYNSLDIDTIAYRLACLKYFGCLDYVDADRIAREVAAAQVGPDWKTPAGYARVDVRQAQGLFHFGWCDLRSTRGALWTLQTLGRLDLIDREACIEGILRFYKGRGEFRSNWRTDGIHIYGQHDDGFLAMESLRILGALHRVGDLARWDFPPKTTTVTRAGHKPEHNVIAHTTLVSWAYRLHLQQFQPRR